MAESETTSMNEEEAESSLSPAHGNLAARRALGVYVHFPFCAHRCPYCDFAVDPRGDIPHQAYADAVCAELEQRSEWFRSTPPVPLVSIYFGGGTPGRWNPESVKQVLETARSCFGAPPLEDLEITLEANPGEIDRQHLERLRRAGVNRVSFGVQSLDNRLLRGIGRAHDAEAARAAITSARRAGFDNVCADLMYGLPGQSMEDWLASVRGLIALEPDHITAYALTIAPGTPFASLDRRGQLPRPDDDRVAAMFEQGRDILAGAGYAHYEVSSYARPHRRSRHNSLYWTGEPYLGVGASAASFRPIDDGSGLRFSNPRSTATYLRSAARNHGNPRPARIERRSATDLENEAVWLALRMADGLDRAAHTQRHGRDPLIDRESAVAGCVRAGWLEVTNERLRLTPAGFLFADEVAARLFL